MDTNETQNQYPFGMDPSKFKASEKLICVFARADVNKLYVRCTCAAA